MATFLLHTVPGRLGGSGARCTHRCGPRHEFLLSTRTGGGIVIILPTRNSASKTTSPTSCRFSSSRICMTWCCWPQLRGMVGNGVADRMPLRLRQLIYLEPLYPPPAKAVRSATCRCTDEDAGQCASHWLGMARATQSDAARHRRCDKAWAVPRRVAQPIQTFEQPLSLGAAPNICRRTFIYCRRHAPVTFRQFADRAQREGTAVGC